MVGEEAEKEEEVKDREKERRSRHGQLVSHKL